MNVTSTPGEGSRFEVWLPGLPTAELLGQEDTAVLPLGRGETILMVADDSARLIRDEEMLAALGYEPVGFTDPEAALAACRARPERFDALLVAHFGSVKASLELAAALHQAAPGLPIVLETRSAEEIGADSLVNAGIADVVRWPMPPQKSQPRSIAVPNQGSARRKLRPPQYVRSIPWRPEILLYLLPKQLTCARLRSNEGGEQSSCRA